jgi:hypothetical protein
MDDLLAVIIIFLLVGLLVIVLAVYRLAFHELERRYKHTQRLATGNYKVVMPAKEWEDSMRAGSLAVGVKDAKTGAVALTMIIERDDATKTP